MKLINKNLHQLLSGMCIFLFIVLVLDVLLGISSRAIGYPVRWTEELATFLLVWLVFTGAAVAYREKAHLGIDLLVNSMHESVRPWASLAIHGLMSLIVIFIFLVGGVSVFLDRLQFMQMMSTLGIPKAFQYLSLPVSGLFLLAYLIESLGDSILTIKKRGKGDL